MSAEPARPDRPQRTLTRACLIVAVVALLPYLLLPAQPVIYDGQLAILDNEAVQTGPLPRLFAVDFWGEPTRAEHSTRSYRPLVGLTWALQSRALGESAALYHLADMLLHGAASALVVLLLACWGVARRWLVPAGLLFALHPLQTDAVASAVGRADVLAGICLFGALALHARASTRSRPLPWRIGALLLLAAGLLCKEYAVSFPFILIATDVVRGARGTASEPERRQRRWIWIGSLAILGGYLLLRLVLFGGLGGAPANPDFHPLADASLAIRWATSLALIPLALRLLVLPYALNHHYRFGTLEIPESVFDLRALWGLVLLAAITVVAVRLWRKRGEGLPLLALVLFVLPLAPSLHTINVVGVLFAERFLYIPVAGLALFLAWALQRWAGSEVAAKAATVVLAVVLVVLGGLTYRRVGDWGSMERLARSSLASYPNGSDVSKQLGVVLVRQGRIDEAIDALGRAVEINPRDAQAWTAYADVLKRAERYDEASQALRRVIELAPSAPGVILREAGHVELLAGHPADAIPLLIRASDLMPADARSMYYLAQAYIRSGDSEGAVIVLRLADKAMQTDPDSLRPLLGQALLRMGQKRLKNGRTEDALFAARQAVETGALPPAGLFLAAMLARDAGDPELAQELFTRAQDLDPDLIRKKHDVAVQMTQAGSFNEAIALFEEILVAQPDHVATLFNLGRAFLLSGRPREAIAPLERGLALQDDEVARTLLAQAQEEAG